MRYTRQLIFGIIATLFIASTLSLTTMAAPSGGIGGRPANPDPDNTRSQSIFIHTIDRGESKTDSIIVSNNSDSTRDIELYAVDGVVTNTGAYTCRQKAEPLQDSGEWISLEKNSVTLERGQKTTVDFTVSVPDNADVGEHNACVVFADTDQKPTDEGGISVRTRQAVRVVTTIPGDLKRDIAISDFNVEITDGSGIYTTTLQNTGNVSADVAITATMKSLFGRTVYENTGQYPVISDQKLDIRYENEKLPMWGGWYTAESSIKYDKEPGSFGIAEDAELVEKQSETQRVFVTPSLIAMMVYVLVLLGVLTLIYWAIRRRSRKNTVERDWKTYTVKVGDTLELIATTHGISWRSLARANKINAPYSVTEGQTIKVPKEK